MMTRDEGTGRVTAVIGGGAGFGTALVERLEHRTAGSAALVRTFDAPDDAAAALESIAGLAAVVHVSGDDAELAGAPLTATDAASWEAGCERVLWRALSTLRAAHGVLRERGGGRVVVITASAGVSGAPSSVPFVAASEGIRAMAKSAARQWGALGISVNCVAVPLELLAPGHAGLTSFLPPPAMTRSDPVDDVVGAVEFLGGPDAAGISGATLLVDGGAVMAP